MTAPTIQLQPALRRGDLDSPVVVGHDTGHVILIADPAHAEILARMIARVTGDLRDVDDVDPQLWDHIVVDLLSEKALVEFEDEKIPNAATQRLVVVR